MYYDRSTALCPTGVMFRQIEDGGSGGEVASQESEAFWGPQVARWCLGKKPIDQISMCSSNLRSTAGALYSLLGPD